MSKDTRKTAIVIGAGAGGIATAARLARAGLRVTVVEKNDFVGGRCSLLHTPDQKYRFDQGPSLLLLPNLFRETFHDLFDTGEDLSSIGIDLLRCPLNYQIYFSDGDVFKSSSDLAVTKREVERYEGKGGFERYLAWMAESHRHYELSVEHVLHADYEGFRSVLTPFFARMSLALHPFESIWSRASRYFATERLRRVYTFATMYMGMSPFDAPATYSLLQYTESAEGIWYPRGGFQSILQRLVDLSKERLGVEYRLSTPVKQVTTSSDGTRATGVLLESGEQLSADIVVVNADLVYAYSNLFPETQSNNLKSYSKSLRKRDGSCSSISFYWALNDTVPGLNVHNIFLADEYKESFDSIFKKQSLPDDPSFYVNVPSKIDPSAAPPGCDAIIVLCPVGHLLKSKGKDDVITAGLPTGDNDQDWENLVNRARDSVLTTMGNRLGCGKAALEKIIIHETINTPADWEEKFNLDKGAILGLSHNFFNILCFRPAIRAKNVRNAYFVGASTHPGTGVPIVLAGAKITADKILKDLGVVAPWKGKKGAVRDQGVEQDESCSKLDLVRRRPWVQEQWLTVLGMLLVAFVLLKAFGSGGMNGNGTSRLLGDW